MTAFRAWSPRWARAMVRTGWLASALCWAACARPLEGAPCPCLEAYRCCENRCIRADQLPQQCLPMDHGPQRDAASEDGGRERDGAVEDGGGQPDAGAGDASLGLPEPPPDGGTDLGPPNAQGYRSGTRLDARFMTTGDGLEQFEFFFDGELDTACTPMPADDGTIRCLPHDEPYHVLYADAECKEPLLGRAPDACGEGSRFYHTRKRGACSDQFVALERGERKDAPSEVYVMGFDGTCKAGAAQDLVYYEMAFVSPDRFVLFERELSEPQAGVRAEYYAGQDGSRMLERYVEAELGFPCHYLEHNGSELCVEPPMANVDPTRFVDAACTTPVMLLRDDARCPPEKPRYGYSRTWNADACTLQVAVCSLGDELESSYYHDAEGLCGAEPGEAWSGLEGRAFACSPLNSWEVFPTVEVVHEGGSRIVARRHHKGTFPSVEYLYSKLYDRLLEVECMPDRAADGKIRCLPFAPMGYDYMDPQCTEPVAAKAPETGCNTKVEKYRALFLPSSPEDCAPPLTRVFEMETTPMELAHHYVKLDEETCVEEPTSHKDWLRPLREVPPEDFAEMVPASSTANDAP